MSLPRHPDFSDCKRPDWLAKATNDTYLVVLQVQLSGELTHLDGTPTRYAYSDERGVYIPPTTIAYDDTPDYFTEEPFDGSDW